MLSAEAIRSRARRAKGGAGPGAAASAAPPAAPPPDVVARLLETQSALERGALFEQWFAAGDADALLRALKTEAERLWHVDPALSLRAAEVLIQGAAIAGRPDHGALGLMARADALRLLGQYPQSLRQFEAAAQAFLALNDEVGWARTRIGWLHAMHMLGRADEALPVAEDARDALVRHGEWLRAAALDVNTAVVCQELGRMQRSLQLSDRALSVYAELGEAAEIPAARTRANKALVESFLGNFAVALDLFETTRDVWLRHGQTSSLLRQDLLVAKVFIGQGRYTRALSLLAEIRSAWEREGHQLNAGLSSLCMAECYLGLNRDAEAAALALHAGVVFERAGTPTETARAHLYAAIALARQGDTGQALSLLEGAAAACEQAGLAAHLALISLQRARLSLTVGDPATARLEAFRALDLFSAQGLVLRRAEAEAVAARAALQVGDLNEAALLSRASRETSESRGAPWLSHEGSFVLARVARLLGHADVAMAECERAVASIEQVQSRLAPELRSHFLDDKVQVFREAVDTALIAAGPQRALDYLERAKSRALVDYLAINSEVAFRTRNEAGRDLVDELARLRDEHHWLSNRLNGYGLSQTGEQPLKPAEVPALQEALRERESRIARLLEQVTLQDADRVEGLAGAVPLSAGPPDLAAGTVLLEYFLHEDGGVVFVVRDGEVVAVPLESGTGEVQHHLFRWQLSLDASASALVLGQPLAALQRNALGVLQRLYRVLLAPVEAHLRGARQIVVVPYGAGHAVPWHALHDGSCYLVERAEVWSCPSSSLLSMLEKRLRTASGRPVVFAHGQHGALPHVQREAESVSLALGADVYCGDEATRTALRSAASGCKVLHLAAHGEARLDDPTFAHLQLADGQLAAADVFGLSLNGALVTLSACETGRTVVTGGDELIGLSRGFLYAGAAALVQSLWRVEDESTARLMGLFYGALRSGLTVAAALRQAQLTLLRERDGLPYLWAPFQVIGDGAWCLGGSGGSGEEKGPR